MTLAPGKHEVALALERHLPFHATLVAPGKLDAQLKRPHSTMLVSSTPVGAVVTVNGEEHGKTPLSLTVAEFETYRVDVAMPNGKPWHRVVYAKSATMKLYAKLAGGARAPTPARTPTSPARTPTTATHTLPLPGDDPRGRGIQ